MIESCSARKIKIRDVKRKHGALLCLCRILPVLLVKDEVGGNSRSEGHKERSNDQKGPTESSWDFLLNEF